MLAAPCTLAETLLTEAPLSKSVNRTLPDTGRSPLKSETETRSV